MTAEYFQVVEPRVGTLVSDAVDSSDDPATSLEAASTAAAHPDASPAAYQHTKRARSKPASTKARATHKLWLENPGMSWGALAEALFLTPERVANHLVECACNGMETDITRLAAQLQIGYPNSVRTARSIYNIQLGISGVAGPGSAVQHVDCCPLHQKVNFVCRSHG